VPLFCEEVVEDRIRKSFDYAFSSNPVTHPGAIPRLEFSRIDHSPFEILGTTATPIPLKHGPRFNVLGFRFGNVAYCTDTNEIPESSMPLLEGLDVLILDALRWQSHPTHFGIEDALDVVEQVRPKQTYFTHVNHDLDYTETNRRLPDGVELAYDGQRIPLT
jgi:phosphoribosyl 1,2-cyclic phosphate phosphodiesterase